MSLASNVSSLATRIATEVKSLRTLINGNAADLSGLNTTSKTSVVSAINEVNTALGNIDVSGQVAALIDDTATATTTVWSSSKTNTAIGAAVAAVVDAAPAALDTLNELAAALGDDANYASTITTALSAKAADADVVKLTGAQTVAGIKTFSSAPVVPDAAFAIAKVSGLQTALDAKASTANVGDTTTNFVTAFEAGLV
jgi:hypothetical protein